MAKALVLTRNPDVTETARFVEVMDKLFDCLNVTSFTAGKHARKVFQDPWRPNDFRFKVRIVVNSDIVLVRCYVCGIQSPFSVLVHVLCIT